MAGKIKSVAGSADLSGTCQPGRCRSTINNDGPELFSYPRRAGSIWLVWKSTTATLVARDGLDRKRSNGVSDEP